MSLTDRISGVLDRHLSRRSFVVRSAFVGSALATGGLDFLLRPGSAYANVCSNACGNPNCACSSTCCIGYTEFCCVLNGGFNSCPQGTVLGGWWLANGSAYCDGPRYYMDCNAICACTQGCGGGSTFCEPACDGLECGCAHGSCDNYLTGCFQFRYGQCSQDVGCIGRIACRVVTCVPPWDFDPSCTKASATDDATANQNAGCLTPEPTYPLLEPTMFMAYATSNSSDGTIKAYEQFVVREDGIAAIATGPDSEHLQARLGPMMPLSGDQLVQFRAP